MTNEVEAFAAECIQRAAELASMKREQRRAALEEMLVRLQLTSVQLEAIREVFEDVARAAAKVRARTPSAMVERMLSDIRDEGSS